MEIGYAAKTLGPDGKGLPAEDARKSQNNPNLGRSLELADKVLDWIEETGIKFWRLPSHMAPYGTHPDWTQFHGQDNIYTKELEAFGQRINDLGLRVTKHPGQYTVLGSPRNEVNDKSILDLKLQSRLLDIMGMNNDSVLVLHVGGRYNEPKNARKRFEENVMRLPESVRNRLVLENDDRLWDAGEVLEICQATGLRMVFDIHHHRCHNPQNIDSIVALNGALSTWPLTSHPKIHLSSGREGPLDRPHSMYISDEDWQLTAKLHSKAIRDFDVMLEVKAKDHAVLELSKKIHEGKLPRPDSLKNLPTWPTSSGASED